MPDLSEMLGDTRAVIYLSQASRLPLRMLLDLTMAVGARRSRCTSTTRSRT